jgi:hypothetical protein
MSWMVGVYGTPAMLRRFPSPFAAGATILLAALGCNNQPFGNCTSVAPLAVRVEVNDSASEMSVVDSARGVAKLGTEVDSLRLAEIPPRLEGGTELGTYQVIIDRPGYHEWIRNGVVVSERDACGSTHPVDLVARLQPSP